MGLYDDASLVFLPSAGAGKDTKAYSVKPTDGTGDFTFSRGSNLAATRVGPDGLIEKGRENLFLQSNNFTTTWSASNLTVTSGETGYDGGNAWKFLPSGAPLTHFLYQNVTGGGIVTFSVYAKAAGYPGLFVYSDQSFAGKYFNVENGTLGDDYGSPIDSSITAVGNGWYRCTVTVSHTSGNFNIFVSPDGVNTYGMTADGTSAVLVQDAQMEAGLVATDYIESGASKGLAGLLEDEPRFDYSGGATCPSLLLEPSRTNLVGYSELINPTIATTIWKQLGSNTFTSNYGTSPDGKQNSTRVQFGTGNSSSQLYAVFNTSAADYTGSIYLKGSGVLKFGFYDNASVLTDTITLTSEWKRFDVTKTLAATSGARFWIYPEGAGASQDFEIWGAQCEQASYPTSYIPNHSGGSVTRGSDDCSVTGVSSLIGQSEGTIYIETTPLNDSTTYTERLVKLFSSGVGDIAIQRYGNSNLTFAGTDGTNSWQINTLNVFSGGVTTKIAGAYKADDVVLYVDGVSKGADTTIPTIPNCDSVYLSGGPGGALIYVGKHTKIILFPTRLSNADLETLTTL